MTVKIYGHRGYPARFPENSLEGFKYAVTHGIDGVETDVHRTKDDQLVIMHDECIDRTTNGHGMIQDYTLEELRTFHLANGEPIPTLKEFLDITAPGPVELDIEFKTTVIRYPGIEAEIQRMIEQYHVEDKTMYCSFLPESLAVIKEIAPKQERCLLIGEEKIRSWGTMAKVTDALHTKYYFPDLAIPQRLWTINEPKEMRRVAQLPNVVGIITNQFEEAMDMIRLENQSAH